MGSIPWWGWVVGYFGIGLVAAAIALLRIRQVLRRRAAEAGGVRWGREGTGLESSTGCIFGAMLLLWPVAAPLFARVLFGKVEGKSADPRRPTGQAPPADPAPGDRDDGD